MAGFLLWNVNKKPLDGFVQSLVRDANLGIDIVLLVEYAFGTSQLPGMLQSDGLVKRMSSKRFGVFARHNHRLSRLRYRLGSRVDMWRWIPPSGQEGLIVLLHGLDRRNYDDSTRRVFLRRVADAVRRRESKRNHRRTVIAGDFNAQPFEPAVVDCDGLHAIGVRSIRARIDRTVHQAGARSDFFYNPMWRVYGHRGHPEAGAATYYWLKSRAHELGWFMLDQVVLRPGEAPRFPEDRLRVIDRVGAVDLLDAAGLPDKASASDHLPVVFHWNL
jgi:hypothetical protein